MAVNKIKSDEVKRLSVNPRLKAPGQVINYTEHQLSEYIKCRNDIVFFANNFCKITTVDSGLEDLKLWPFQEDILRSMQNERFTLCNCSRQIGKSTIASIGIIFNLIFRDHLKVAFMANKMSTAKEVLNKKIKIIFENLPMWLTQGVEVWNFTSIELENRSSIEIYATSESACRGVSAGILVCDEVGIIRENLWNEFMKSTFPVVSSGAESKIWLYSTPRGFPSPWHKLVTESKLGINGFKCFEIKWSDIPTRTQKWAENEKKVLGESTFLQEYCCEFIGASNSLIDGATLKQLLDDVNQDEMHTIDPATLPRFKKLSNYFKFMRVFKAPIKDHIYSISQDSATNTNTEDGDSACISVVDITQLPFEQVLVADFISEISHLEIPHIQVELCRIFNNAISFNENNDGASRESNYIINKELEYEYLFWENNTIPGFRTTTSTKARGCTNLKNLIEHGYLKIYDKTTIHQLFQFVRNKNSYSASAGNYDDNISAILGNIFFLQLEQSRIDEVFCNHFYQLPNVSDLLKIIYTTRHDDIEEAVIVGEDGVTFNHNQLLNTEQRFSLNDLIDNSESTDPEVIRRKLERMQKMVTITRGKEYEQTDNYTSFGDNNSEDDDRVKSIDDFIF